MSLATKPIQDFLAELASVDPVPGGGSVAALSGALAASLVAMVCRLTVGRKGYEDVSAELEGMLPRTDALQAELRELMQADVDAYARVMDAYQMPKTTEAEKAARTRSVQEALKGASQVPLQIADRCAELIALARVVVEKGNKNAVCDAGVGALMADAGLRGAAFNVSVNLKSIKDETYLREASSRVDKLQALADESRHEILNMVHARM